VSSSPVKIDPTALEHMLEHAREAAPNECCGLLVGHHDFIVRSVRARNLEASPTRYLIDPLDHFAAIRAARSQGQSVVGAYHSHPDSAPVPSEADVVEASGGSGFLYVIVSLADIAQRKAVRGYRLQSGRFELVELEGAAK
jgi:proteasome lid subunit RPN8/RPN11